MSDPAPALDWMTLPAWGLDPYKVCTLAVMWDYHLQFYRGRALDLWQYLERTQQPFRLSPGCLVTDGRPPTICEMGLWERLLTLRERVRLMLWYRERYPGRVRKWSAWQVTRIPFRRERQRVCTLRKVKVGR